MKVGLFLGMYHIFLISRGLQKNSLLKLLFSKYTPLKCSLEIFTSVCCTSAIPYLALRNLSHGAMTTFFLEYAKGSFRKGFKSFKSSKHLLTTVKYSLVNLVASNLEWMEEALRWKRRFRHYFRIGSFHLQQIGLRGKTRRLKRKKGARKSHHRQTKGQNSSTWWRVSISPRL